MKIGKIYITGTIGKFEGEENSDYTELLDVISQVKMQPDAEAFYVFINSGGGYVSEGFDIYDYLMSLKKPVHTIGYGIVASIATVFFMAGETRELRPNTEFMIHLPSGGVEGDSEEIAEYSRMMNETEDRIIKFYSKNTGLSKEALKPLLSKETWLDTTKAYELGFSNVETKKNEAVAYFNNLKNKKMSDKKFNEEDKNFLKAMFEGLQNALKPNKQEVKNLIIQDANGESIDFPEVTEGEEIQVGAKATIDGADAAGEYVLPNGDTLVFIAGELTEIKTEEEEEEEENAEMQELQDLVDSLTTEKEELTQQNEEVNTLLNEEKEKTTELTNKLNLITEEVEGFKNQLTTKFGVDLKGDSKKKPNENLTSAQKMKAKLAEKRNNKRR